MKEHQRYNYLSVTVYQTIEFDRWGLKGLSLLSRCSQSVLASSIYARATDTTNSSPAPPMIDVGGGSGGGNGKDGDEAITSSQRESEKEG